MSLFSRNRKLTRVLAMMFVSASVYRVCSMTGLVGASGKDSPPVASAEEKSTSSSEKEAVSLRHFNWPESHLDELVTASPFGLVKPVEIESAEETTTSESTVQELPVEETSPGVEKVIPAVSVRLKAVYQTEQGPVALLGSKRVRVGDVLENGCCVLKIENRHMILQLPQSNDSQQTDG